MKACPHLPYTTGLVEACGSRLSSVKGKPKSRVSQDDETIEVLRKC